MQGAPPLASPRPSRRQHGITLRNRYPAGGLSGWLPADRATVVSARGACLPCRLLAPAFSLLSFPIPRPRSQSASPPGKGETLGYFYARGSAPCIPAPEPEATRDNPAEQIPGGGLSGWLPADRVTVVPARGLAFLPPANPAFSLLLCPHPRPPSSGEGGRLKLISPGASPRHPCIKPFAALTVPAVQVPGGARPPPGTQTAGIAGAARVQPGMQGAKPLA